MTQIFVASLAMSLAFAALSLYAGHAFRRGRVVNGRLVFIIAATIGFLGMMAANIARACVHARCALFRGAAT